MRTFFKEIFSTFKKHRHPLVKVVGIALIVLVVINIIYYFGSLYSPVCLTCHYMKPYYEQSVNSTHKDVSCVKCHPNRRILTAPYLLKYISGSYNPRPRAEVDDDICLECHEEQNLKKQTAFAMHISFSHADHLEDLKRGKKLRCTSCHARGEDEHFKVDENVCYTCHFKGVERGHSATGCSVCHGSPKKIIEHSGFQFNHEAYLKIGVDCSQCHIDVVSGNAEVDKKKCYQCHVERLEEFSNIDKIHSVHIADEGVDCEECHNAIHHGRIRMISSLEANCENCHQLKHTLQREIYIGGEGKGVTSTPSRMFAAQVSCEGCHLDLNNDGKSDLDEKRKSCVKCHEKGYDVMLDKWISSLDEAVNKLQPDLEYAKQLVLSAKKQGRNVKAEGNYLNDAEFNFRLVKEGRGAHNLDYAVKLLENVAQNIEGISERLGNKNYKANRSSVLTDDKEFCNLCHFAITPKDINKFGDDNFPHQRHMSFVNCTSCHSKTEHKKITVTKKECQKCHKNFSKVRDVIQYGSIKFPHNLHSKKRNISCTTCHATLDFSKIQIKKNACTNCHHKDKELIKNCPVCHSYQNNIYSGIIFGKKHEEDIMKAGGVSCEDCHIAKKNKVSKTGENVCTDCHDASYRAMQLEWINDIKSKVKTLSSLLTNIKKSEFKQEGKDIVQNAKKLISAIRSDKSNGLHNYMMFNDFLDKSIKDIKKINSEEK